MTKHFDVSKLRALLKRVEAATGPDAELDAEIAKGLTLYSNVTFYPFSLHGEAYWEGTEVLHDRDGEPFEDYTPIPKYTASIDAATALIGCVLPGRYWVTFGQWCVEGGHTPGAQIDAGRFPFIVTNAATPALALCEAMLHALIASEETRAND
jgi:hypothetical protein